MVTIRAFCHARHPALRCLCLPIIFGLLLHTPIAHPLSEALRSAPAQATSEIQHNARSANCKTLEGSKRSAMNHHRTMLLSIRTGVFEIESFRHDVIYLHRAKLPLAANRILQHEVDLRSIESSLRRSRSYFPEFMTRAASSTSRSARSHCSSLPPYFCGLFFIARRKAKHETRQPDDARNLYCVSFITSHSSASN